MKIKVFDIVLVVLFIASIGYIYYLNNKIESYKVSDIDNVRKSILKIDSINTAKEKQYLHKLDSIYNILHKKDSLLEIKNKRQDERIRQLTLSPTDLPNF